MRSQFILILTSFFLLAIYGIYKSFNTEYFVYDTNIEKYIAYSFWLEINTTSNSTVISKINSSYYQYCKSIGIFCTFNGTHILLKSPAKLYVLRAK